MATFTVDPLLTPLRLGPEPLDSTPVAKTVRPVLTPRRRLPTQGIGLQQQQPNESTTLEGSRVSTQELEEGELEGSRIDSQELEEGELVECTDNPQLHHPLLSFPMHKRKTLLPTPPPAKKLCRQSLNSDKTHTLRQHGRGAQKRRQLRYQNHSMALSENRQEQYTVPLPKGPEAPEHCLEPAVPLSDDRHEALEHCLGPWDSYAQYLQMGHDKYGGWSFENPQRIQVPAYFGGPPLLTSALHWKATSEKMATATVRRPVCPLLTRGTDSQTADGTLVVRATVETAHIPVGLDTFSAISALDRRWAQHNLPTLQLKEGAVRGFGAPREVWLATLLGQEAPLPPHAALFVVVLGQTFRLNMHVFDFPESFPVPCLLGADFFRSAGNIQLDFSAGRIILNGYEELLLPPDVVAASMETTFHSTPCLDWCPTEGRHWLAPYRGPLPPGLPTHEHPMTESLQDINDWIMDLLPLQPSKFIEELAEGRHSFDNLRNAYSDVMKTANLKHCRCHLTPPSRRSSSCTKRNARSANCTTSDGELVDYDYCF